MITFIENILLAVLAILLAAAATGDLKNRIIPNWLNATIALLAVPFWWAAGLIFWPQVVIQIGFALILFLMFALAFRFGAMGGGDVKMISAIALWLDPVSTLKLLLVMSLAGAVLTVGMVARQRWAKLQTQIEIPYGVAIAFAGFWVISERYLNQFG